MKKQLTVKCEHLAKRLLAMAGTEESPDALLFASVIALALIDMAYSEDSFHMHTARHYIFGRQMQKHCELIGVDYDFIIDRTSLIFRRQPSDEKTNLNNAVTRSAGSARQGGGQSLGVYRVVDTPRFKTWLQAS